MNIRLYHPDSILENNTSLLSKEHTHYVVNVMRLKRGSNLNFFNKNGEWKSEIIFLDKDRVEVRFLEKIKEVNNLSKTELAICLVKKIPMDNILQKATELGISKIIPIISERTEVKELNLDRAKKIVIEATEQSNQLVPPNISDVIKLKDFLLTFDENSKILFADVNSKENLKTDDLKNIKKDWKMLRLIEDKWAFHIRYNEDDDKLAIYDPNAFEDKLIFVSRSKMS